MSDAPTIKALLSGEWWVPCDLHPLQRGQYVWAFLPHVDLVPYVLVAEGRAEADPGDHSLAKGRVEQLRISSPPTGPKGLPVAGLPQYPGEVWAVNRAKIRPGIVVCTGGADVPKDLRPGTVPKWQTAPTFLVAPCYGVEQTDARSGWHPPLIDRIRRCEYPQFMLEHLPPPDDKTRSVVRFDQIQPVGKHHNSYRPAGYKLSDEALDLVDEWIDWLRVGLLDAGSALAAAREMLMAEDL